MSIIDNQSNSDYSYRAGTSVETVVVTGSRSPSTPILAGQVKLTSQVTAIYAAD